MRDRISKINLEKDRSIINLLGEICWGFQVDDFDEKIGVNKGSVEDLLERLLEKERLGVIEVSLKKDEVEIIKRALKEVEQEIEEWEFQTRIGATLERVKKIALFK